MKHRIAKYLFPVLITTTLFSLWAGIALLVVNPIFHKDLPGYTIGRICIWEYIAIFIAILITKFIIHKWGNIEYKILDGQQRLVLHANYGLYFGIYFLILIAVAIWQFYLFSLKF